MARSLLCHNPCMSSLESSPDTHRTPAVTPVDRRQRIRYECTGLIDVYRTNGPRYVRIGAGLVENISEGGLRLQMDMGFAPGTQLRLRNRYVDFTAVVRYTERQPVGYFMGVEFVGTSRSSGSDAWADLQ